jgi:hypothetical protein
VKIGSEKKNIECRKRLKREKENKKVEEERG